MKYVIAPDSYKNCMRSTAVCEVIARAISDVQYKAEIVKIPMADGGEGTIDAVLMATSGEIKEVEVSGPLGHAVIARYALINNGKTAVTEMAEASGLELITSEQRNPLRTCTFGTGELIRSILSEGIRDIIIGIGGSATVDGGLGMARALGYMFLDKKNNIVTTTDHLSTITSINTDHINYLLKDCRLRVACDVTNPLLGPKGAAAVFGPQKGATAEMIPLLEQGLANLYKVCFETGIYDSQLPGDGAAGGLGAGLRTFCAATIESGAHLIAETVQFEKQLQNADYLITGEGCTDLQTLDGKLCSVVAKIAQKSSVKTVVISGAVMADLDTNLFDYIEAITPGSMSLDQALESAKENLYSKTKEIILKINQ